MSTSSVYICVNCGCVVKELYKKYSPSVLKVMPCNLCSSVADKYIEYDPVITFIDLILLSKPAYRHVLYNAQLKNYWKIAVVLLLIESYIEWSISIQYFNATSSRQYYKTIDLFIAEKGFYRSTLHVLLGTLIFVTTAYALHIILHKCNASKQDVSVSFYDMWKALTLSSFGQFMLFPALIWSDATPTDSHILFVSGYTMLSQLLVYSVICNYSRLRALIIIMAALAARFYFIQFIKKHTMLL